jgi:signal transduction histidine kinase
MSRKAFDAVGGLAILGEMVRLTAPPAGRSEICDQGLALTVKALGPSCGLMLLRPSPAIPAVVAATWGKAASDDLRRLGLEALDRGESIEEGGPGDRSPRRIAVLLPGDTGAVGAVVLDRPAVWDAAARIFSRSAARAVAAALRASGVIEEIRAQGELLARRNLELETLREFGGRMQGLSREEEMLQQALDLVLDKLGLDAGWIFWGDRDEGRLELAAARGVVDQFVKESRERGIGACLCQDVFATGTLRFARNTLDCPRLPDLIGPHGPQTHACIPLKFERGVLGVMNIAHRPGQTFGAEELTFLETYGQQLCLAVDKARTARGESQRDAEARALASLTHAIGGSLEQDQVLTAIGDYGRELLAADRCSLFLGDGSGPLTLAYLSGPPLEGLQVGGGADLQALGSQALLRSITTRHPMVIQDTRSDPRASAALARRWNIGSVIIVPLLAHDRLEGILAADRERPSTWNAEEIELAHALAGQAALAIENVRLYREAKTALLHLQQAQYGMMRAERLAAVGTLAASLAHEVRNPLNSINLQLVLLTRRVGRLDPRQRQAFQELIDLARREIARLDGLVEEFLSLSTIDRLTLSEGQPEDLVREVIGLMTPVARQRGVDIEEQLAGALPRLRFDNEKIKQVLINLVRNAVEAMPDGGRLRVSTGMEDGMVVIRVADTGVGIEPGLDVFDFFMTTKRGGTGLGLPIARRIVEGHGGTLRFESEPGKGTVFTFTLKTAGRGDTAPEERQDR